MGGDVLPVTSIFTGGIDFAGVAPCSGSSMLHGGPLSASDGNHPLPRLGPVASGRVGGQPVPSTAVPQIPLGGAISARCRQLLTAMLPG